MIYHTILLNGARNASDKGTKVPNRGEISNRGGLSSLTGGGGGATRG